MTKRTSWPMRVEAGTTNVGTARVRDDSRPTMTAAQKAIYDKTGNPPQVDAGFDEIADGVDSGRSVPLSMQKAKTVGDLMREHTGGSRAMATQKKATEISQHEM